MSDDNRDLAASAGGTRLEKDSGDVLINLEGSGFFYQICCDCGLTHKVHVRGARTLQARWERVDEPDFSDVDSSRVEVLGGVS